MNAVRGIGFDLDHTLAIDNRLERVAFLRLLKIVLERGGGTVGTLADEIENIDGLLKRQRHGEITIDDAVRLFGSERGLEPNDWLVELFYKVSVDMIEEFVVPMPGLTATLEALKERGMVVAVLTNGWSPFQRRKAEQAGFDGPIVISSEIGERKPSKKAFDRLLEALGTQPEQTCYVGDDPTDDIAGARDAGLQAVWMNWERRSYPDGLVPPEHTISSLAELLALVPHCVPAS